MESRPKIGPSKNQLTPDNLETSMKKIIDGEMFEKVENLMPSEFEVLSRQLREAEHQANEFDRQKKHRIEHEAHTIARDETEAAQHLAHEGKRWAEARDRHLAHEGERWAEARDPTDAVREATYMVGFDEDNADATFRVQVNAADRADVHRALGLLFKQAFPAFSPMKANVAWTAGVPGDPAVVWGARSVRGSYERFLHVSFENGRRW